jgi:hypothetical protein
MRGMNMVDELHILIRNRTMKPLAIVFKWGGAGIEGEIQWE